MSSREGEAGPSARSDSYIYLVKCTEAAADSDRTHALTIDDVEVGVYGTCNIQ